MLSVLAYHRSPAGVLRLRALVQCCAGAVDVPPEKVGVLSADVLLAWITTESPGQISHLATAARASLIVACCGPTDTAAVSTALASGSRMIIAANQLGDMTVLDSLMEVLHTCWTTPRAELLTERDRAVLRGMAAGRTNRDIGEGLYLATDTVKSYARHIYRTLGARNRAHAVALAYRQGLIG